MTEAPPPDFGAVAREEAAHAAAALALPVVPRRVWIDRDGVEVQGHRLAGACEVGGEWIPWSWHLAVIAAGPAAAVLHRTGRPGDLIVAGTDLDGARPALNACPWISREDAVHAAFGWLQRDEVRPVVEALARELLARYEADGTRGDIDGAELWGVAFAGWTRTPTWGLVREWGLPLRRAFPPARPGTPRLEVAILRGVVHPASGGRNARVSP